MDRGLQDVVFDAVFVRHDGLQSMSVGLWNWLLGEAATVGVNVVDVS